jgi:sugar phosphate permease
MKPFLWILLALSILLLGQSIRRHWSYRRRGEDVPWQFAGNIAGALGMVCMVGGMMTPDGWVKWLFLGAAMTLLVVDAVVFTRARRHALSRPTN